MDPMASYRQYCPVAKAAEVLADRWTPLIVRELLAGAHRFNELERGLPGISRPLLAQRLRRLAHMGVVARRVAPDGHPDYHLTQMGRDLKAVVDALGRWGMTWVLEDPAPSDLDPALLLWRMRRRINRGTLPPRRVVVQFDFTGTKRQSTWLVVDRSEISVCLEHPGFDVDLVVTADTAAFHRIWLGRLALADAIFEGHVHFDGPPGLIRSFQRALLLSPFAGLGLATPETAAR